MSNRKFTGGIEPGSLRGSRPDSFAYVPQDTSDVHSDTLKEVASLDAQAFKLWKKQGNNGERLAAALRFKKEKKEDDANS
jgi:hypothetical protein